LETFMFSPPELTSPVWKLRLGEIITEEATPAYCGFPQVAERHPVSGKNAASQAGVGCQP
jgi:hypothetical protein